MAKPTTAAEVSRIDFYCPRCNAEPGELCIGKRGIREAVHKERWRNYLAWARKNKKRGKR